MQFVIAMLPVGEMERCGQSSQSPDPAVLLNLPAAHALHVPPLGPDQPALQAQLAKAVLCAGELESAGHDKQVDEPVVSEYVPLLQTLQTASPLTPLYLPATHAVQAPPLWPQNPLLQAQLVTDTLPSGAVEFSGHARHTRFDPIVHAAAWKNPAVQFEQSGAGIEGSTTNVVVRCLPSKSGLA